MEFSLLVEENKNPTRDRETQIFLLLLLNTLSILVLSMNTKLPPSPHEGEWCVHPCIPTSKEGTKCYAFFEANLTIRWIELRSKVTFWMSLYHHFHLFIYLGQSIWGWLFFLLNPSQKPFSHTFNLIFDRLDTISVQVVYSKATFCMTVWHWSQWEMWHLGGSCVTFTLTGHHVRLHW